MHADATGIESLEPKEVWRVFAGIAAVPRPSKREEQIREHIHRLAKEHGLRARQEAVGNIIIDVPATPGHEQAPITVLQGHLDMVAEKNRETAHDFDRDPIRPVLDRDPESGEPFVRAEGTTLGADNGMGVALAFAAAASPDVVHGPLELLLTTDEEAGMTGAKALTPESFKGRRLLNLDSEEDNCIYIGCAGGCDTNLSWTLEAAQPSGTAETCRVIVEGLRGGHSGGDIHQGRGNAIKLLARTLLRVNASALRIGEFVGGSKRNAIPREAHCIAAGPAGTLSALREACAAVQKEGRIESYEDGLVIRVEPSEGRPVASETETARLLAAVAALPSGVIGMHPRIPTLVETSNNVSTVVSKVDGEKLELIVGTLSRSSSYSRMGEVKERIAAIGRLAGAGVAYGNDYPGWEPNVDSSTLAICRRGYEQLFGEAAEVAAIHAGLECGIIGERVGDMDMVSFGPRIEGAHSPDERVYVASVAKSWKFLKTVLAELAIG